MTLLIIANVYALVAITLLVFIYKDLSTPMLVKQLIVPIFWPIWLVLYLTFMLVTYAKNSRVA